MFKAIRVEEFFSKRVIEDEANYYIFYDDI